VFPSGGPLALRIEALFRVPGRVPGFSGGVRMRRSKILALECLIGILVALAGIAIHRKLSEARFLGREGVVWQRDAYDCGAAALQMVLMHFRIAADYDRLSLRLEVNSGGTSMLRIKHAAESHGLRCQGWRLTIRDLSDIPRPAILFLRRNPRLYQSYELSPRK